MLITQSFSYDTVKSFDSISILNPLPTPHMFFSAPGKICSSLKFKSPQTLHVT